MKFFLRRLCYLLAPTLKVLACLLLAPIFIPVWMWVCRHDGTMGYDWPFIIFESCVCGFVTPLLFSLNRYLALQVQARWRESAGQVSR